MKLLSFDFNGTPHVGVAAPEGIVDLTRAMARTHPDIKESQSLRAIIQSGLDIDTIGEQSLAQLRSAGVLASYLVANPSWLPPILRPPKILALALNYQEHIDESNLAFFNEPIIFAKYGVLRNRVVAARQEWRNFAAGVPTGPLVKETADASGAGRKKAAELERT